MNLAAGGQSLQPPPEQNSERSEFRIQQSGSRIGEKFDHPEPDIAVPVDWEVEVPVRGVHDVADHIGTTVGAIA